MVRLHAGYPRNLSSVDIAKCETQVFTLEKILKIGKTSKTP